MNQKVDKEDLEIKVELVAVLKECRDTGYATHPNVSTFIRNLESQINNHPRKKILKPIVVKGLLAAMAVGAIAAIEGLALQNIGMTSIGILPVLVGTWVFYPGK